MVKNANIRRKKGDVTFGFTTKVAVSKSFREPHQAFLVYLGDTGHTPIAAPRSGAFFIR